MSQYDFYASEPASAPAPVFAAAPPARRAALWPWVSGGIAVLALVVGLAVVLWPHSAPSGPDLPTARLFGQQTRLQLPDPVTSDDCFAAVRAFPKIAADVRARAAFVDGCMRAG